MDVVIDYLTLQRIGLILNLVGTVMIGFSFGKTVQEAYQEDDEGNKVSLAAFLSPPRFYLGMLLLGLGFVVQFFA